MIKRCRNFLRDAVKSRPWSTTFLELQLNWAFQYALLFLCPLHSTMFRKDESKNIHSKGGFNVRPTIGLRCSTSL